MIYLINLETKRFDSFKSKKEFLVMSKNLNSFKTFNDRLAFSDWKSVSKDTFETYKKVKNLKQGRVYNV